MLVVSQCRDIDTTSMRSSQEAANCEGSSREENPEKDICIYNVQQKDVLKVVFWKINAVLIPVV